LAISGPCRTQESTITEHSAPIRQSNIPRFPNPCPLARPLRLQHAGHNSGRCLRVRDGARQPATLGWGWREYRSRNCTNESGSALVAERFLRTFDEMCSILRIPRSYPVLSRYPVQQLSSQCSESKLGQLISAGFLGLNAHVRTDFGPTWVPSPNGTVRLNVFRNY